MPLLCTSPSKLKAGSPRGICTCTYTAALFSAARRCKQPKCLSKNEWVNKAWYIIQWNIIQPLQWRKFWHIQQLHSPVGHYVKWNKLVTKRQIPCHLTYDVHRVVNSLPTMQETRVQTLGWEDPLEKAMAPHSRTLAWKIPWTEDPDRLQSMGSQRVGHDWATSLSLSE